MTLVAALLSICAFHPSPVRADPVEEGRAAISEGNYDEAVRLLLPLAEQGNPVAQNAIGVLYLNGWGLNKNPQEAIMWFRRAANQGELKAYMSLGVIHERGLGVVQNCVQAVKWYRRAAERGLAPAQVNLGNMYDEGRECIKGDHAEALKWYRKAAEQGDALGQTNLGQMYFHGKGVKQDFAEAMNWYRKAAAQGSREAQFNLGVMFELGQGVPRDKAEAVKWYRMAANQGDPGAIARLDDLTSSSAMLAALRPPSLDQALSASAMDLATGLYLTKQCIRYLLPLAEKGAKLQTGLIPGLTIDRNNVDEARSVLQARLTVYETAVRHRGYKTISGNYRAEATPSCERIQSIWAGGIGAGAVREVEIKQDGYDIQLMHQYMSPERRSVLDVSGVVAESVFTFADPMNSDFLFSGKIGAKKLTIRPEVDKVLAAWPRWFGPPSRQDLKKCKVTLVPRT